MTSAMISTEESLSRVWATSKEVECGKNPTASEAMLKVLSLAVKVATPGEIAEKHRFYSVDRLIPWAPLQRPAKLFFPGPADLQTTPIAASKSDFRQRSADLDVTTNIAAL